MPYKDQERAREWGREHARKRYATDPLFREIRAKRSKINRTARVEKARVAVHEIKSAPCMDCGGVFDPVCMDFDHRPGEVKRSNVSTITYASSNIEAVMNEIAKCDLVCSNCHRLRTKRRREVAS